MRPRLPLLAAALAALAACSEPPPFREPLVLGGRRVAPEVLNRGRAVFQRACKTCHGDGDGQGPTGFHLTPRPRDFTRGVFKFGSVAAGSLPTEEDLRRIVRDGLAGTGMLPWKLSPGDLEAVVPYLMTLSPRWREEPAGEPIVPGPDPWAGREAAAAARGDRIYHVVARCQSCHPAYASPAEIAAFAAELGRPVPQPRPRPGEPVATASDFGGPILAPDLARDTLRSVRPGSRLADLYRVIAAGVGGTSMPTWKGALPEEELWALVHYVDRLPGRKAATASR